MPEIAVPYTPLPESYRGRFPFRICAPSYIYPDHILPNVRMLDPCLDEIELLLFESRHPDSLPDRSVIRKLGDIRNRSRLAYNVHLPADIFPGDPNPLERQHAVETLVQVMELCAPLSASTHTLHLPFAGDPGSETDRRAWSDRVHESLTRLGAAGVDLSTLSVETLDYPLEWVEPMLEEFALSVCIDTGHLVVGGRNPADCFKRYGGRTSIVHLHGVENGRDHRSLCRHPKNALRSLVALLEGFTGTVSLEVFSYPDLKGSLALLADLWRTIDDRRQ